MNARSSRLDFVPGFQSACDARGRVVRFTKSERAILSTLSAQPGVIYSRQQLLDAVAGEGSDNSDRTIDFVINRLRRKLGDAARAPRYIATQYGEGYSWIPVASPPSAATARAFAVVGPIRSIPPMPSVDSRVMLFAESLRAALSRLIAPDSAVVLDAGCPDATAFSDARPTYSIELDVLATGGRLDCAITAREFHSGRVLHVSRQTVAPAPPAGSAKALATDLVAALWRAKTRGLPPAPDAKPLPVRMQNAGIQLSGSTSGIEVEQQLRATLAADPDSHETRVMLATAIHSRLIMGGAAQFVADPYTPPTFHCDVLERLVTAAIPHVGHDPINLLAAAKLLYFVGRGHERLAVETAERELTSTTAIVAALAVTGQIRQFEGDIVHGAELLDRALSMTPSGTVFSAYLRSIRLAGALATGEREAIDRVYAELIVDQPGAVEHFELHCAGYHLDDMSAGLWQRITSHSALEAAALLRYSHFMTGRLFKHEGHRANFTRGIVLGFCRAQGADFVPKDIKRNLPTLFAEDGSLRQ